MHPYFWWSSSPWLVRPPHFYAFQPCCTPEAGLTVLPLEEQVYAIAVKQRQSREVLCWLLCYAECKWCETAATVLIAGAVLTGAKPFWESSISSPPALFPSLLLPMLYFINLIFRKLLFKETFSINWPFCSWFVQLQSINCWVFCCLGCISKHCRGDVICNDEACKTYLVLYCSVIFLWIYYSDLLLVIFLMLSFSK